MKLFKSNKFKSFANYLIIVVASFIYAAGLSLFLDKSGLAAGGVTGISVILSRVTGVETGTLYFLLNIPIIIFGLWKFGVKFIIKTFLAVVCTSLFTNSLARFDAVTDDLFLAAVAGSVMIALGIGMIFKAGGTTGGMDIVVKALRIKYPHLKTGSLFLIMDCAIVLSAFFVIGSVEIALYTLLSVIVAGKALDWVLYRGDAVKLVFIITDSWEKVGLRLMSELDVGITYLNGKGGYTRRDKTVIMCVAKNQVAPRIEGIIKEEDNRAFMIVTSANEIFGEGYKDIYKEKL